MADTYTIILIHALFGTKDRQPWLTPEWAFLKKQGVEYDPRHVFA